MEYREEVRPHMHGILQNHPDDGDSPKIISDFTGCCLKVAKLSAKRSEEGLED